jgi:hypothetical protein
MDAKVTLSFNAQVIEKAKAYAEAQGISLSRLTEILLSRLTTNNYQSFEDFPVADWVTTVSEGEAEYIRKPRSSKELRSTYHKAKK